ncbi:MAG: SAM-dependent methyltransferase [Acidobacteriota bacterium]
MKLASIQLTPIGTVHSTIQDPIDDVWGGVQTRIELDPTRFAPDCLDGLDQFSHLEIVFLFDQVTEDQIHYGARHPRGRMDWPKVGIFAQRAKNRPNRLGVTACKLIAIEGLSIKIEGLDAIDGTPVLDIKPYMEEFRVNDPIRQPAWSHELMAGYWLPPR